MIAAMLPSLFSASIRTASARLFVSCLGDLTIFSTAVGSGGRLSQDDVGELAVYCFRIGMERTLADLDPQMVPAEAVDEFTARTAGTDWASAAKGENAFAGSGRDIVRFAPVIDEFKALDQEIVSNSIRFRWRDVREQLRKRIEGEQVRDDWHNRVVWFTASEG